MWQTTLSWQQQSQNLILCRDGFCKNIQCQYCHTKWQHREWQKNFKRQVHSPLDLEFSTIFGILLSFILLTWCSQFYWYLLSFSSNCCTFNSSKISSLLLWSKRVHPAVCLKNFISIHVNHFYPFFLGSKFCFHIKELGEPVHYKFLFLKISGPKLV